MTKKFTMSDIRRLLEISRSTFYERLSARTDGTRSDLVDRDEGVT